MSEALTCLVIGLGWPDVNSRDHPVIDGLVAIETDQRGILKHSKNFRRLPVSGFVESLHFRTNGEAESHDNGDFSNTYAIRLNFREKSERTWRTCDSGWRADNRMTSERSRVSLRDEM